ncbi:claudin-10 [Denticeps clupeoides]|uniref:Claudin-10-like n=1 Tax=Denticeps clupeoides TaxID=299321 RepID=A0AAY4E5M4_9TELE|nr:claudin-10-like [Denticeps clupeoides]
MKVRAIQILGFLFTMFGWIFIGCSMAMEGWKVSAIGGQGGSAIMTVAWYWSSLWRACFTDSTAVTNCYDFPVLWSVEDHIQVVRALLMGGMTTGVLGFVLSLMGMECTYIGGKDREKNRTLFVGGCCHVTAGLLAASGYAVYSRYVSADYFNPSYDGLKYVLGTPIFIGFSGSMFHMTGGLFHLVSLCKIWSAKHREPSIVVATEGPPLYSELNAVSEIRSGSAASSVSDLYPTNAAQAKPVVTKNVKYQSKPKHSSRSPRKLEYSQKSEQSSGSRQSSKSSKSSQYSKFDPNQYFIKNSYI